MGERRGGSTASCFSRELERAWSAETGVEPPYATPTRIVLAVTWACLGSVIVIASLGYGLDLLRAYLLDVYDTHAGDLEKHDFDAIVNATVSSLLDVFESAISSGFAEFLDRAHDDAGRH